LRDQGTQHLSNKPPLLIIFSPFLKKLSTVMLARVDEAIGQIRRGVTVLEPSQMLMGKGLGDDDVRVVSAELRVNTARLTALDIGHNAIDAAGAASLAQVLYCNTVLAELSLDSNYVGAAGAASIAEALRVNTSLTVLDITNNSIGAAGAAALAEALGVNATLKVLHLWENNIGDAGISSLANALRVNVGLAELHLFFSSIGDAGAVSLAEALRFNTTLTDIGLDNNSIGATGAAALAEALEVNTSLTSLGLSENPISTDRQSALFTATRANKSTTARFKDLAAPALADILRADFAPPANVPSITTRAQSQHAFIARLAAILRSAPPPGGGGNNRTRLVAILVRAFSFSRGKTAVALAREALAGPLRDHPAAHVLQRVP
jgi:hypothetical protein